MGFLSSKATVHLECKIVGANLSTLLSMVLDSRKTKSSKKKRTWERKGN